MPYNPSLKNINYSNSSNKSSYSSSNITSTYGRVLHVVLSKDDEYYEDTRSLYSIIYTPIRLDQINSDEDFNLRNSPRAYLFNSQVIRIPLVDEIVQIVKGPGATLNDTPFSEDDYYTFPINIFNDVVQSGSPRVDEVGIVARKGTGIDSIPSINKINLNQGDILFQGRLGQSIRFTGFPGNTNTYVDETNKTKPLTILRNGRSSQEDFKRLITENVNLDDSSIYLTTDHIIPTSLTNHQQKSFEFPEDRPVNTISYKGRQIVIDSGRLVLNSKDDDILLSSLLSTSIASKTIHLDASKYIGIDSTFIFLGSNSFNKKQPVVLGQENSLLLLNLLKSIKNLATVLTTLPTSATAIASLLIDSGEALLGEVESLERQLPNLLSKKIFVE